MRWSLALAAGWLALWGLGQASAYLPASWWLVPGDLVIEDAPQGQCARVHYDRIIRRPFAGEFTGVLQRQGPTGGFYVYAVFPDGGPGRVAYSPDAVLPDDFDLGWWLWTKGCDWPVGIYRLLTQWEIRTGGPPRFARVMSNQFRVLPPQEEP